MRNKTIKKQIWVLWVSNPPILPCLIVGGMEQAGGKGMFWQIGIGGVFMWFYYHN